MQVSRKKLIFSAAASGYAAAGILRWPAGAAEFDYKFGTDFPANHPITTRGQQACETIVKESGGRLDIKFFPNSILGAGTALVSQMRAGAIEFEQMADFNLSAVVPITGITALPFAFPSYKDVWNAIDGSFGAYLRSVTAKTMPDTYVFEKRWDSGFRQVANVVRPVNVPDDFKGLKIRVPASPINVALFKALGASPVPINARDVYVALQTHLVDGMEASLTGLETEKEYEVTKYISMTNHAWTGVGLYANLAAWQKLPKNLRDSVEKNFNGLATPERNDMVRIDQTTEATLKGQSMIFSQPDLAAMRGAVRSAGLYAQWRDNFGVEAWALLEKAVGKLT